MGKLEKWKKKNNINLYCLNGKIIKSNLHRFQFMTYKRLQNTLLDPQGCCNEITHTRRLKTTGIYTFIVLETEECQFGSWGESPSRPADSLLAEPSHSGERGEREFLGLSLSYKDTSLIMGASPSGLHLNLSISRGP